MDESAQATPPGKRVVSVRSIGASFAAGVYIAARRSDGKLAWKLIDRSAGFRLDRYGYTKERGLKLEQAVLEAEVYAVKYDLDFLDGVRHNKLCP
jgi:hypothetical protein